MGILRKLKEAMGASERVRVEKKGAFAPKAGKLNAPKHKFEKASKKGAFHKKSGNKK